MGVGGSRARGGLSVRRGSSPDDDPSRPRVRGRPGAGVAPCNTWTPSRPRTRGRPSPPGVRTFAYPLAPAHEGDCRQGSALYADPRSTRTRGRRSGRHPWGCHDSRARQRGRPPVTRVTRAGRSGVVTGRVRASAGRQLLGLPGAASGALPYARAQAGGGSARAECCSIRRVSPPKRGAATGLACGVIAILITVTPDQGGSRQTWSDPKSAKYQGFAGIQGGRPEIQIPPSPPKGRPSDPCYNRDPRAFFASWRGA